MNQSIVSCPFLNVASCRANRFLRRQVVRCSHLFKNFLQLVVIHIVKGFSIVNKALNVFLELTCIFDDPTGVDNLTSGSSVFSKFSLFIWKFSVHILLKPSLKDFEHYRASTWNKHDCMVVWTFFGIAFLWDWTEKWPFPVLWPLLNVLNQKRKVSLFVEKVLCQILVSFQKSGNIRTGNYFQEKY